MSISAAGFKALISGKQMSRKVSQRRLCKVQEEVPKTAVAK